MKKVLTILFVCFSMGLFAQDPGGTTYQGLPNPLLKNGMATFTINFGNNGAAALGYNPANPTIFTVGFARVTNPTYTEVNLSGAAGIGNLAAYFTVTGPVETNSPPANNAVHTFTFTQKAPIPASTLVELTFSGKIVGNEGQKVIVQFNAVPGSTATGNTQGDDAFNFSRTITGTLPVSFGSISALFKGNTLAVNWETASEKNNKEFVIEASANGTDFEKIGTVASAAKDGSSDTTLKYSFSKSWDEVKGLLGFPIGVAVLMLSMMAMVFVKRSRRLALLPAMLFAVVLIGYSCQKKDEVPVPVEHPEAFVRIGQVDIDGTVNYSATVKVVEQ